MSKPNAGYLAVLAKYPDFHRRGAVASNRRQLATLGVVGYRAQRVAAYCACVTKHGREITARALQQAHAVRRAQRLAHPTAGEQRLHAALQALGYQLVTDPALPAAATTALLEAPIGRFWCDALLPAHRLILEVYGGVHVLQREYDQWRRAELEAQGYRVVELDDQLSVAAMIAAIGSAIARPSEESPCSVS